MADGERAGAGRLTNLQAILIAFGLWVLLGLISQALQVLVLVALALVLAAGLSPVVRAMRRPALPPGGWRVPTPVALLAIYGVGAMLVLGLLYFVVPTLLDELSSLAQSAPSIVGNLADRLDQVAGSLGYKGAVPSASQLAGQVQPSVSSIAGGLAAATAGLLTFLVQLFVVLTLAFLLVVRTDEVVGFWVGLFAPRQRPKVRAVTSKIGDRVGHWLLGQLAVAAITGTLAGVGSAVLGLPYPVLLGVTTAVVDLAPAVGPTVMAIPAGLLGLSISPLLGIGAAAYFLILAQVDGNLLSPFITGRAVRISPVVVVVAVPVGIALYGPIGGLLGVPTAAAIQVVLSDVVLPWLHRRERAEESRDDAGAEAQERAA